MAAKPVDPEQFVAQAAARHPSRLQARRGTDEQHLGSGPLTHHRLAHRNRGKEMTTGTAARDNHFHRTAAGLRARASKVPIAAIAITIAVPP